MNINHRGSLMTVTQEDGSEAALGYLFNFTGHGIFSPDGKVEVTEAEMAAHNLELSKAEIKGLDENCQVGQGGMFYYIDGKVQTWMGAIVSADVRRSNQVLTFYRNGRTYRGRLQRDSDCFNFERVA